MARRLFVALLFLAALPPLDVDADWLIAPFLGTSFGGETSFLIFEEGAGRRLTLGGSLLLLTDTFVGVEVDVGHTPRFFEGDDPLGLVLTSRVTTLSGSVIVAAPLALTRESLRPYVVGGFGLMQARGKHAGGLFPVDRDLLSFDLGAGALGFLTPRTGLRFDVRHFKAVSGDDGPFVRPGVSRMSFWRATVGVVLRY